MSVYVASFKAFGDFVIAFDSRQRLMPGRQGELPQLLAAPHLKPLAQALGAGDAVHFLDGLPGGAIPAAFDIRGQGVIRAIGSLVSLRRAVGHAARGHTLLCDQIGWRQRFIGSATRPVALPALPNIYAAYTAGLSALGFETHEPAAPPRAVGRRAVIVPASRIARKTIPASTLAAASARLARAGLSISLLRLTGESFETPVGVPVREVPRHFEALIDALRDADLVISADSLAAHLGEHVGRPTFVFAPAPNEFWLPPRAFDYNAWATFDDPAPLDAWLGTTVLRGA